jgi:uncharacterized protein (TIGR03437 family)
LQGEFLYADYCSGSSWGIASGSEARLLLQGALQSFSSFGEDENGELYIADQGSGAVFLVTAGDPATSALSVVNAASFAPGISPGSLATVFGTGLTTFGGIVSAGRFPLPTSLVGTSVTLNGIVAPIIATASIGSQEQINFQVPYELAGTSRATLVVTANGRSSSPVDVPIAAAQPEVFMIGDDLPAVTTASGEPVRPDSGAARGSVVTIYATGLGGVMNAPASGRAAVADPLSRVVSPVEVRIGGVAAPVSFAGLAPGFAGLYQINAQIPGAVAPGSAELVVSAGGATSSAVSVAVR